MQFILNDNIFIQLNAYLCGKRLRPYFVAEIRQHSKSTFLGGSKQTNFRILIDRYMNYGRTESGMYGVHGWTPAPAVYVCLGRRANKTASRCEICYLGEPKQREYIGDRAGKTLIMMIDGCEMNAYESVTRGRRRCVREVDKEDACSVDISKKKSFLVKGGVRWGRATGG